MIDKRVSMSKKLGKVSDKARTLWFMIYPHLDREGRIAFEDLEDLKDEILPKFKDWELQKIGDALNELADINLIQLYPNGDDIAIQYNRFEDFQSGLRKEREAESKVSSPGVTQDNSGVFRISPALRLSIIKIKIKEGRKEGSTISPEPKITFCFKTDSWLHILPKDIQRWKETYPACDIDYELKKMADWLIANPTKKKKNYKSFISRWLTSTQDKGGSKGVSDKYKDGWAERYAKKMEEKDD